MGAKLKAQAGKGPDAGGHPGVIVPSGSDGRRAAVAGALVAVALFAVVGFSDASRPRAPLPRGVVFPSPPWLRGWVRWDSGWYGQIAQKGYSYTPGRQTSVTFFPGYPLAMRVGSRLVGGVFPAGISITLGCGIGFGVLLYGWLRRRLPEPSAWTALLLLLLYPYAFYLFGAVYADALFLLTAIAAFVLLEGGYPMMSGLVGAVATATRPFGAALVVGLAVQGWERRHGTRAVAALRHPGNGPQPSLATGKARQAVLSLYPAAISVIGLAGYCGYLWVRFGHPLLFVTAEQAWEQGPGLQTWLKFRYVHYLTLSTTPFHLVTYLAPPALTVAALALVPGVVRRFGWGYGLYTVLAVTLPALGSKDFFGMGRYLLAAFPGFAVAGDLLAARPRLRALLLTGSATGLVLLASAYARGHYVS